MSDVRQIAVTGAAGQISYALLFRIAAGELYGPNQPVFLRLLDVPEAQSGMDAVAMELQDCAYPLLRGVMCSSDPAAVFEGADVAYLIGARPRSPGMERRDLLEVNARIFAEQGRCLAAVAKPQVKVLVVGNPANTNALIARYNAPNLPAKCFSAMTRLDHNRAVSMLAAKCGVSPAQVRRMIVWGNHSTSQYPDLHHALVDGVPALSRVERGWYETEFIPAVQQRGAEVIARRGKSSAASAANAALDQMRDWLHGTADGDWVSMAVLSEGQYGIEAGLVYSFPVVVRGGEYHVVEGLDIEPFSADRMRRTELELCEERDAVAHLLTTTRA